MVTMMRDDPCSANQDFMYLLPKMPIVLNVNVYYRTEIGFQFSAHSYCCLYVRVFGLPSFVQIPYFNTLDFFGYL